MQMLFVAEIFDKLFQLILIGILKNGVKFTSQNIVNLVG